MRAVWRGMLIAGLSAATCAQPPAPLVAGDALQRYIERTRESAAALEPAAAREQRLRERSALLVQGEAALARGEVDAALGAFERAALMLHAADTEMALVRAYMQAGEYRRAVSFSAHTAGAHRQVVAGAVLYAWLLSRGGQDDAARRLIESAAQVDVPDPMLRDVQRLLVAPAELPRGGLIEPPVRLAPYSVGAEIPRGARVDASGVLVDQGRRALVPLASLHGARARWVRNGLGHVARASVEQRIARLGIAVLKLDPTLPSATAFATAPRDPFPGSPGYAVEFTRSDHAAPAWPRLRSGFHGMPEGDAGVRRLGIDMPPGPRGGPVFDAAGRFAGIAVAHAGGRDRIVMTSTLRSELAVLLAAPVAMPPPSHRAPVDEIYEAALRITVQLITTR